MSNLNGLRILNTRPQEQGQALEAAIKKAGGHAINFPTLEIKASTAHWLNQLSALPKFTQMIFISANAVHYYFKQLSKEQALASQKIPALAIGQATASALLEYQIIASIPQTPDSEHLLQLPSLQPDKQQKLLLIKGEGGRRLIEEHLLEQGAKLTIVEVYKRVLPTINHQFSNSLWRDDAVDIILLTSEQSIQNLFKLFSPESHGWLKNKPCLVLSERLAQAATRLGFKSIKLSHPNQIINTLLDYKDYIHGGQQ